MTQKKADVAIYGDGSIVVLFPQTKVAEAWCGDHLPQDCPKVGGGYAVEHRFAGDILEGMVDDGLSLRRF